MYCICALLLLTMRANPWIYYLSEPVSGCSTGVFFVRHQSCDRFSWCWAWRTVTWGTQQLLLTIITQVDCQCNISNQLIKPTHLKTKFLVMKKPCSLSSFNTYRGIRNWRTKHLMSRRLSSTHHVIVVFKWFGRVGRELSKRQAKLSRGWRVSDHFCSFLPH